jgi:ribonucleoside-triphosphate reductase (thioredoxin)
MGNNTSTSSKKASSLVHKVQKRDGKIVDFDFQRIVTAIHKAMTVSDEGSEAEAALVANKVLADLVRTIKKHKNFIPTVEGIQDSVEKELILSEYVNTAKNYILYRQRRSELREKGIIVPEKVRELVAEGKKNFRNPLGEFMFYRTYSKWMPEEGRRETWIETVDRYISFMKENLGNKLTSKEYKEIREAILHQESLPSMRLLQFAGGPARSTNVTAYNCSFIAPECFQDFAEVAYISMCGTGVGYSVESQNIQKLPQIKYQSGKKRSVFVIPDSKEGWADSIAHGMTIWADGEDVEFDYSKIRPAGARLSFGGKASGPDVLRELLDFIRMKMLAKQGKRLSNIDAHDILCKIGEIVVSGGVRRSALISLSDLDDTEVRDAKKGQFYLTEPQRSLANNSAVYNSKPTNDEFLTEWVALMKSGSGERGIFNRGGLMKTLPERRLKLWQKRGIIKDGRIVEPIGTNPCGEIILQSKQFCNLSEVVCRAEDTEKSLMRKIRIAAILGTYQATLTNFRYLSKEWKKNCEDERLLGVSLTGQWDCPVVQNPKILKKLRDESIKINTQYAKRFGISASTCVTCVKPSGNGSQTVDSSSGMHPRHSKFYIRRVRISSNDSLFRMLKDQGVPHFPEVGQNIENASTFVLEFPVRTPEGVAVFKNSLSAIEQLEYWKMVKINFTEHNPSTTISVGENEWIEVANWLYENWEIIGGLSFLPRDNHVYKLAPYEEIDEKRYNDLIKKLDHFDFSKLITYEREDETEHKKELACASGVCEIDDIPQK